MLQLSFVNFKMNSYLLVEGTDTNDRFFIIQTGKVTCYHETKIPETSIKILGPGDFVGVTACMSGHSQMETVIAQTDVTAIAVRRDQYPELIMKNTPIAMKIVRYFAREMRVLNDLRTKITLRKNIVDSPEELFRIAEHYEEAGYNNIAVYGYYQYLKRCPTGTNAMEAKRRFMRLKPKSTVTYFEPSDEMLRRYPADTMIFSECQNGPDMFIIQEGTVRITKVVDNEEVTLALLKKGDMFGEMALLEDKPRSASAIAHSDCRVMVVNHNNFDQMVSSQPGFIARLSTMLADRVWSMYRQLVNGMLTEPRERMIDMLALQIEGQKGISYMKGVPLQTDLSPQDIINLCGIPPQNQKIAMYQLSTDQNVKIRNGKINVPDVPELLKQAAFYRKQNNRRANENR
ncbi:MAG TPA: cAMP-binding protein [Treponema sp.]|nr:cAMP-binding protein [Treponema sp.]